MKKEGVMTREVIFMRNAEISAKRESTVLKTETVKKVIAVSYVVCVAMMLLSVCAYLLSNGAVSAMYIGYIGGAIGISGMIFNIICLRYDSCPGCEKYLFVINQSDVRCPKCGKSIK